MRFEGASKGRRLPTLGIAGCAFLCCLSDGAAQEGPAAATAAALDLPDPVLTKSQLYRTLTLRDGSKLTGRLVEFIPSQRITILLADGSAKTIELAEVIRIEPVLAPKPAPAPAPAPAETEEISVQLTADRPIELYSVSPRGKRFRVFSGQRARELLLPLSNAYEVDGEDVHKSPLRLLSMRRQRVEIRAGSASLKSGGTALVVLGVLFSAAGVATLFGGGIAHGVGRAVEGPNYQAPLGLWITAGIGLPIGLIGIVAGVIITPANTTRVSVVPDGSTASLQLSTGIRVSARGLEF